MALEVCLRAAAKKLDDGRSEASTVALGLGSSCAGEFARSRLIQKPDGLLFCVLAAVFIVMGIIGIYIPAFGDLPIHVGDYTFRVWAIGLIGMAAAAAIGYLRGLS